MTNQPSRRITIDAPDGPTILAAPNAVLGTENVTIEASPDGPQIHCTVIELDADQPEQRTVPLVVAPPDDWPVYETMTATTDPQPAR